MTITEIIVSTLLGILITAIFTWLGVQKSHVLAIARGVQALLRNKLYEIYFKCEEKGYATMLEKNNFDNLYQQYHSLGKNGVMNEYYKRIMAMPNFRRGKRK